MTTIKRKTTISFEFFPPKHVEREKIFWEKFFDLTPFQPDFVSITYGAGGGDRGRTRQLVVDVARKSDLPTVAHVTCVGDSLERLTELLDFYQENGIKQILALRGDQPRESAPGALARGDFDHADAFVAFIRKRYPSFRIGVAAYPEGHPESPNRAVDLDFFRRKVDAGADFAVTQFFFNNQDYFRFVEDLDRLGVRIPVLAGIMPVTDFQQIIKLSKLCGSALPGWLTALMEKQKDNPAQMTFAGIQVAVAQCRELLAQEVAGLHFFTLNQSAPVAHILKTLHLDPNASHGT
ncbi:MAG: methylenetetrahydrofolate reductase [NAD(P)H] [Magnetococcus sp. DMHC-6]